MSVSSYGVSNMHPRLEVLSLSQAKRHKRRFDAVLTIEDPLFRKGLRFHTFPRPEHLVLKFEDIDTPACDFWVAELPDIEQGLDFARQHSDQRLLVHCFRGVSRSTALAYGILADRLGPGNEEKALQHLLHLQPDAVPNALVAALCEATLGRNGKLIKVLEEWVKKTPAAQSARADRADFLQRRPDLYARRP